MEVSSLVVRLVVLLFPGLIATVIFDHLTEHRDWSPFFYSVYSILFGATAYIGLQLLLYLSAAATWLLTGRFALVTISFWQSLFDEKVPISSLEIAAASIVASSLAVLISTVVYHKILIRTTQRLGITSKYGDDSLFMHFMGVRETKWIYVRDRERGYIFEGWPLYFSHRHGIRELVLTDVKVYDYSDPNKAYSMSRVYLSYPDSYNVVIEEAAQ